LGLRIAGTAGALGNGGISDCWTPGCLGQIDAVCAFCGSRGLSCRNLLREGRREVWGVCRTCGFAGPLKL
jgi:hypothetical protein